jgi:hypothetical protein
VATALLAIAIATLRSDPTAEAPRWGNCLLCGERGLADAIVNFLLFVPLGASLGCSSVPAARATLFGTLVSALVEATQRSLPGRDPSVGDVLFNALGTSAGWLLRWLVPALIRMPARPAARLSVAAAAGFGAVVLLTGALLTPSFPPTTYWGQWTPALGHLAWYGGQVKSATVGGVPAPSRRLADSPQVRRLLLAGAPIRVQAIAGPRVMRLASLFSIADQRQREIVLIGPDRDDLVFRFRTGAARLRLDHPDVRLRGGTRDLRVGDSWSVAVWTPAPGRHCLARGADTACGLGFTVGAGWTMLYYPEALPSGAHNLLNGLWVTAWLLPVGLLLRWRWESGLALGLVTASLIAVPGTVSLHSAGTAEWAAAAAAVCLGAALRARHIGQKRPTCPPNRPISP